MSRNSSSPGNRLFKVVVNREEGYSIWPADREGMRGWQEAGFRGTRSECQSYIRQVSSAGKKGSA